MKRSNSMVSAAASLNSSGFADPANEAKAEKFARSMNRIPRVAVKCEIYGTISVQVDRKHALNIFRKVFPGMRDVEFYTSLNILQDRLDDRSEA